MYGRTYRSDWLGSENAYWHGREAQALRALTSHPEIKSRVLSGEITLNAGMVEAQPASEAGYFDILGLAQVIEHAGRCRIRRKTARIR